MDQDIQHTFEKNIRMWFKKEKRKFYWRELSLNPWEWLVLEILLKRTRAETVEKFFPRFIKKYCNPKVLVETSDKDLEKELEFLGLQKQRREALKKIGKELLERYDGEVPLSLDRLISLPHVGRYVANAVLCFSQNKRRAIVDVNVARVLTRFLGKELPKDLRKEWVWELAENMLPLKNWKEYNYSLLDFGALVCTKNVPKCNQCVVNQFCMYNKSLHESQ